MLDRIDDSFSAQRATEAKLRRFAADASHELRTPLTSIRGYAELYRRGGDDAEQVARSMGRIEAEAGRMSQLVEDLLTLTRLDEGRPLDRAPVDVAELAAKVVDDARVVEDGHPLHLDAPSPAVVDGDANRLTQVLVNLVANAQRHTPAGTRSPSAWRRDGTTAVIEVVDHGPGLEPRGGGAGVRALLPGRPVALARPGWQRARAGHRRRRRAGARRHGDRRTPPRAVAPPSGSSCR